MRCFQILDHNVSYPAIRNHFRPKTPHSINNIVCIDFTSLVQTANRLVYLGVLSHLLGIPRVDSETGRRAFSYAAPKIWAALPKNIRTAASVDQFKSLLKTHLFSQVFRLQFSSGICIILAHYEVVAFLYHVWLLGSYFHMDIGAL